MPIQDVLKILQAFKRYLDFINNHGYDEVIEFIQDMTPSLIITMRGHMGETYELEVYLSGTTGELCIDDPCTNVSLFDFGPEILYEITEEELHFIRFGKER